MSTLQTQIERMEEERAARKAEVLAAIADAEASAGPVEAMEPWAMNNLRIVALDKAVELCTSVESPLASAQDVVATAEAFLAFLTGGAK